MTTNSFATKEEALESAKAEVDQLLAKEEADFRKKQIGVFLMIFIPLFIITYGTVSKVVVNARTQKAENSFRPNQINSDRLGATNQKR